MNKKLIIFALATVVVIGAILLTPSKSYGDCDFLPIAGLCNCGYSGISIGVAWVDFSFCYNNTCHIIWVQPCRSIKRVFSYEVRCQERWGYCSKNDGMD